MKLFKKSQEAVESRPTAYPNENHREEGFKKVNISKSHEVLESRPLAFSSENHGEEGFKRVDVSKNRFGSKAKNEPAGSFGARKTVMPSSFPIAIDSMREEAMRHQEGGEYHLMILLKELSVISDQDDFLLMMDKWGSALAKDISNGCQMFSDEQRFDVIVTYLNQILMHKRMGVFQCDVKEAERTVIITYYFSKFDYLMLANFGETLCVTLYSAFFKNLLTVVAESVFEVKSIEASGEFWRFTLKA